MLGAGVPLKSPLLLLYTMRSPPLDPAACPAVRTCACVCVCVQLVTIGTVGGSDLVKQMEQLGSTGGWGRVGSGEGQGAPTVGGASPWLQSGAVNFLPCGEAGL